MAMTLRTRQRLIRILSAMLLLGCCAFAWLAIRPAQDLAEVTNQTNHSKSLPDATITKRKLVDPKSTAWQTELRNPLYDPPPPPPKVEVKKELPPIRAKLLGTIIEPGASRAMISYSGGAVKFRGVGELLGEQDPEAIIDSIGPSSIRIKRGDETTELTVDRGY